MMNQPNVWFMIYVFPQTACQRPIQVQMLTPGVVLPLEKVEEKKCQKLKQEIKSEKWLNEQFRGSQDLKRKNKIKQEQNQSSSFSLPVKQQYKTTQQKLGRNSASNILRLFTKLLRNPLFKQKYTKIKQKYGFEITFKEFNSWIAGIGLNMNKYIRMKKILNGAKTKPKYGRILSILYSLFQSDYARSAALTSSKTEAKNILPTLSQIRNIREEINEAVIDGFSILSERPR